MRFGTYLTEAFDRPYPFKLHVGSVTFYAEVLTPNDVIDIDLMYLKGMKYWYLVFNRNNEVEITGEGDAFRIFATVIEFLRQVLLKDHGDLIAPLDKIVFDAEKTEDQGSSRTRLYDRMVNRFASKMGYKLKTNDSNDKKRYILHKGT